MESNASPKAPTELPAQPLLTGLFLFVVAYFVAGAVVGTMVILIPGWREALEGMAKGDQPDAMALMVARWVNGLSSGIWLGLPAIVWAGVYGRPAQLLRLNRAPEPRFLLLAAAAIIASLPLAQALIITPDQVPWDWLKGQGQETLNTTNQLLGEATTRGILANLLFICLLPAFFEEIFFRGFLQHSLGKLMSPLAAVTLSAAVFSLMHMQFLVFFPRFALGLMLGYFYWRTGKMWVNVAAHFTFNFLNVALAFLAVNGALPAELFDENYRFPLLWVGLSAALTAGFLYWFHRSSGDSSANSASLPS